MTRNRRIAFDPINEFLASNSLFFLNKCHMAPGVDPILTVVESQRIAGQFLAGTKHADLAGEMG